MSTRKAICNELSIHDFREPVVRILSYPMLLRSYFTRPSWSISVTKTTFIKLFLKKWEFSYKIF